MKKLTLIFICFSSILMSCKDEKEKEIKAADKYEKTKLSLEEIEKQNPEKFISVAGSDKKNLLGQTVVKGKITNNAKMATFKDVDVKLFFYSKTGVLLEEDQEMIYETIAPGGTQSFKSKYFAPKGTDSIAMKVVSAKY
jgi:predicted methyltransferase MtxX (methanogen marker protein 4)